MVQRAPMRSTSARRTSRIRRFLPISVALMAALVFVTLTNGGRAARQTAPALSYVDAFFERIGLGLNEVVVTGQRMTLDRQIYEQLRLSGHRSIWLIDTEAARKRIEGLPWVKEASLKRVFPDRLQVVIQERSPTAIWSDGRQTVLIDNEGQTLGPASSSHVGNLPTIFGTGAAPHVNSILATTRRIPELSGRIGVFEWTANRRWTLHLTTGQRILLPEKGQALALLQMTKGPRGRRLIDTKFKTLDLRVASQASIQFIKNR